MLNKLLTKLIEKSVKLSYRQHSNLIKNNLFVNVGVFGGYKDGKTTLCSAISKVLSEINSTQFVSINQLDNSEQEIDKGSTIFNSELFVFIKDYIFSIQDGPGQECYLHNAIMSLNRDLFLLVISPNTSLNLIRRNLIIFKHFGIKDVIIFLSKIDTTNEQTINEIKEKLLHLLEITKFHQVEGVITGSPLAVLKENNQEIGKKSILNLIQQMSLFYPPTRDLITDPLMFIEIAGQSAKYGAYVKGILNCGVLFKGQEVDLIGLDREATSQISDIYIQNERVDKVEAGTPVILGFKDLKKSDLKKGMVICLPSSQLVYDHIECKIYCFREEEIIHNQRNYYNGNYELWSVGFRVGTRVNLIDQEMFRPGDSVNARLELRATIALKIEQKFLFTFQSKIIGVGTIVKVLPNLTQSEKIKLCKGR